MPFKGLFKATPESTDEQAKEAKEAKKRAKEEKKRLKAEEKEKRRQFMLTDEGARKVLKEMGMFTESECEEDMAKDRLEKVEKKLAKLEKEKAEITMEWGEKWGLVSKDELKVMDEVKVEEEKPKKKLSLGVLKETGSTGGLASKDELKIEDKIPKKKVSLGVLTTEAVEEKKPKKKLSLYALTDKDLKARFDGYEKFDGPKEDQTKPKKKFSLGTCVENMDEDEKWRRCFCQMGIGSMEDHKKFSEEMERNKLPEDTPLSKTESTKFLFATFAIGLILFGLINVFFNSSSAPLLQFTFRNQTYAGYGLLLNWSKAKKEVKHFANFEIISEANVAVLRTPGGDVPKEILITPPAVEIRLQYYLIAFFGYPLLGATLLAGLLHGIFCRSVEVRTVTLVETIDNEDFGVKIKGGKICEVTPGGLADVSGDVDKGDRVIRVNGVRIGGMADENVVDLMNAREGELKLTLAA